MGIEAILKRKPRLRWFGHVERKYKEDWYEENGHVSMEGIDRQAKKRKIVWKTC